MNKEEIEKRKMNVYFEDPVKMHRWRERVSRERWYYEALTGMTFRCYDCKIEGEARYANMN